MKPSSIFVAVALVGCTTQYAYNFQLADPGVHTGPGQRDVIEDDAVKAALQITDDTILLDLTNKTGDVLQVAWNEIAIDRGDGTTTALRPTTDLGWIQPGGTATAVLVPFALPRTGAAATRYEGRRLELTVPVIALREPKTYRFHFVAHVHSL